MTATVRILDDLKAGRVGTELPGVIDGAEPVVRFTNAAGLRFDVTLDADGRLEVRGATPGAEALAVRPVAANAVTIEAGAR